MSKSMKTSRSRSVPVRESEILERSTVTDVETQTGVDTVVSTESQTMRERFETLIVSKQQTISSLRSEIQELRRMMKDHESMLKTASKTSRGRRVRDPDAPKKKPSGFASPVVVSDQLYSFLSKYGVKRGEPVARTTVTKYITQYIREHSLQNPEYKREIVPDSTLKKLFGSPLEHKVADDPKSPMIYTYLKLQKYLTSHFPKRQTPSS